MKPNIYLSSALLVAGLLLTGKVNAQWTHTGTVTYLNNSGDKVGIGTTTPTNKLEIRGSGVNNLLLKSTNDNAGILIDKGATNKTASVTYRTNGTSNWQTGCLGDANYTLSNTSLATTAIFCSATNNRVGLGTTSPAARLSVANTSLSGIGTTGSIQVGGSSTYNLVMDNNEVQARYDGTGSTLYLNYWAGNVDVAASGGNTTIHGPTNMYSTANIYGNAYFGGSVGIGISSPTYTLDVTSTLGRTSSFVNTSISVDHYGVYGACYNTPYYGYGVVGYGGYIGLYGAASLTGTGTRFGVYGYAYGGTTNWAVYASGATYSSGGYTSSDAKLKKDVLSIDNAMDKINRLKPRTYNFKTDQYNYMGLPEEKQYGFIAQELETVFPELVRNVEQPIDNDKKNGMLQFKAINYTELIPVLTQAMQEQNKIIDKLQSENEQLKSRLQKIEALLQNSGYDNSKSVPATEIKKALIEQNQPNPFNMKTVINYYLPADTKSAVINITSTGGQVVRTFTVTAQGEGQLEIDAYTLSSGSYTYQLVIDGKTIDSKQMIITK